MYVVPTLVGDWGQETPLKWELRTSKVTLLGGFPTRS